MRFFAHVGKRSVAIVVIQNIFSVIRHEQVFISVVLVISDTNALSPPTMRQPGFFRHVGECSIVIVVVEMIGRRLLSRQWIKRGSIHHKNIRPSVVVVIEDGYPRASRLKNEFLRIHSAKRVRRAQACFRGFVYEVSDFFWF